MATKGNNNGTNLTVEILRDIRDEIRSTNQRLDTTREDLGRRIDETNRRLVESETRLATAILGMKGTLEEVRDYLKDQSDLRRRVERLERQVGIPPEPGA
jgi:predicted nuclease with TOPRIM domain